jgi:gliding motility-associated protein GldM
MGHGKETPRQKMIGMMYLVLTALLALNVSKSVLDAFVVVDEGIVKMNENYAEKNKLMYAAFDQAAIEKPQKAKKWKEVANEVKKKSDDLYEMIQGLKLEIVGIAEKGNQEVIVNGELKPMKIAGKDNTEIPAQVMIVSKKGAALKKAIESFREYLLSQTDPKAEGIRKSIEQGLNTSDPKPTEVGKTESWESEHFEHLPLVAVTTVMTGLQSNIRNTESDMLRYLFTMIDKGTFKFTSLEGTVIPNSSFIIQGNEYSAKVFLAAFDTSQNPTIYIGPYDSLKGEDGSYEYKLKSGFKYDSLPVKNGKGVYTRKGGAVGYQKWGGLIKLKAPEGGQDILKPFKSEYQVAEAQLVVSPTKMNVFYTGVDNPVDISVPGVPSDKVFPSINNGTIKPVGKGSYIVNPIKLGKLAAQVTVTAEIDKKKRVIGVKDFNVKMVPDPVAKVNGIKNTGFIEKSLLLAQFGVMAEMENFDFDLSFKVIEFNVSVNIGGFSNDKPSKSNKFTPEQMALIKQVQKNQKVYIEAIKAVGPDGIPRSLGNISLTIR